MLTQDALNAAIPLAQLAFSKKLSMSPVANTPVGELMKATQTPVASSVNIDALHNGDVEVDLAWISQCTNSAYPGTDYVAHDEVFDNVVAIAADAIRRQINFAKTVVGPVVQEIVEKTKVAMASGNTSKIAKYRVEPFAYPNLIFNNSFETLVEKSLKPNSNFDTMPELALPVLQTADIAKLLDTGTSAIDRDAANWTATLGLDFIDQVWTNFFSNEKSMSATNTSLANSFHRSSANTFGPSGYDVAVAVFLIATNLSNNPPAGSNVSATTFESLLGGYREVAARVITEAMNEADMATKSQVLVRSRSEYVVSVNSHVYNEWLQKEENCSEALLGMLLEDRLMMFVDDINAQRERMVSNWERHVRLIRAAEAAEEHVQIRSLMINYFNNHFKAQLPDNPGYANQVYNACKNFEKEMLSFTSDEIRSLWMPATKAVCRAAYPASNAEEILIGMEEASRVNPSADPRELAAIVVIEMAARWAAEQIQVTG